MGKRLNPYQRLVQEMKKWAWTVQYPRTRLMLFYEKEKVNDGTGFMLLRLAERTRAAEQLGYRVEVRWNEEKGLEVFYVKRQDDPPMAVRI